MTFDEETIEAVWQKGRVRPDRPPDEWRKDECGAWMRRDQYGNERSDYGWKIQNTAPGNGRSVRNLRPFHVENGYDIAARRAHCRVTADREGLAPSQHVDDPRNRSA